MSEKIIERTPEDVHNNIVKLLQENQQLKEKIEQQTKVCLADHKYASSKEDEVIVLTHERDLYKSIINELNEELSMIDDDIMAVCENYDVNGIELKKILDKAKGSDK